jgi:hypothetical protein
MAGPELPQPEKHGLDGVIPVVPVAAHALRAGAREGTREVRR